MARSPAVNALNELADELCNAACFIGKPFTVDSREAKDVIRRVVRDSLASGATRDDVWRFMQASKCMFSFAFSSCMRRALPMERLLSVRTSLAPDQSLSTPKDVGFRPLHPDRFPARN
jgi:hypothetical protein